MATLCAQCDIMGDVRILNVIGDTYGRLTVIANADPKVDGGGQPRRMALVQCECGNVLPMQLGPMRDGRTTSCGCFQRECMSEVGKANKRHGMWNSPEHAVWRAMKDRCLNPRCEGYGGRGITVCAEWANSFERFYGDVGSRPSEIHSLDRVDNDGNYEPGNVRWATRKEQANNTRSNRSLTFDGRTQHVSEWATELGIPHSTIHTRLTRGETVESALSTTRMPGRRRDHS
jgi:hypothetical protein